MLWFQGILHTEATPGKIETQAAVLKEGIKKISLN
jgi:hypothetical protein